MSVSATLIPIQDELADAHPELFYGSGMSVAFGTSTLCSNFTLTIPDQDPLEIPGISHFVSVLKGIPGVVPQGGVEHSCLESVDCTGVVDSQQKQACQAGNAFVEIKRQLMEGDLATGGTEEVFRCDMFRYPQNGIECNPINMVQAPNGSWSGDCLRHHDLGFTFTERLERNCTLAEFDQYVKDFDTSLTLAINRLDNVTARAFRTIETRMRNMVHTHLLDPIAEVADGLTCGFMPAIVDEVVDGVCYQLLTGFKTVTNSYQLTGLIILVLLFDMYFLWRLAYDNLMVQHGRRTKGSLTE